MNSSFPSRTRPDRPAAPLPDTTPHRPSARRPNLLRHFLRSAAEPVDRPARHNRACAQYIALLTLVVIFACALYFAISNWRGIDPSTSRWLLEDCFLVEEPSATKLTSDQYRVQAEVNRKSENGSIYTAFYGRRDATLPRDEAVPIQNELLQSFKNHKSIPCWVNSVASEVQVSLRKITPSSSVYLAWTGTFMAAVIGVILVTVCSTSTNSPWLDYPPVNAHITQPPVAKSVHLTERQALRVCARFEQPFRRTSPAEWTCSICLDDDDAGATEGIKTVLLPCRHRFHSNCIKHWLWKGKGLCPLCKWDARAFINAEKRASVDEVGLPDSDTATTATVWSSPDAPNSQTSIALTIEPSAAPSPTPAPAPAPAPQTQNVSHVTIDTDLLVRDDGVGGHDGGGGDNGGGTMPRQP